MDKMKKAAAIKYSPGETAPAVVAKGSGYVADKILEKAELADIPVYKDEKLVEALTKVDLGDNIPPELYEVVAEILVFVDDLDNLYQKIHAK